jgi:hypothetical protein
MISSLLPEGADLKDPKIIKYALKIKEQLRSGRTAESHSSALQRLRRRGRGDVAPAVGNLQGAEIKIWANQTAQFKWLDGDRESIFPLYVPSRAIPVNSDDKRYLNFEPDGISIRDKSGKLFKGAGTSESQNVTFTKGMLGYRKDSEAVKRLWEYHVGSVWEDVAPTNSAVTAGPTILIHPPGFYLPVGPAPLRTLQSNSAAYSKPPVPGEGPWLMNEFINSFSDGVGAIFSGQSDKFKQEDHRNVRLLLATFVKDPKYSNYPHLAAWTAIVDDTRAQGLKAIIANLAFCRDLIGSPKVIPGKGGTKGKLYAFDKRKEGW